MVMGCLRRAMSHCMVERGGRSMGSSKSLVHDPLIITTEQRFAFF